MKIYHNPRCRKSRETLAFIKQHNIPVVVIEYLKQPLSKKEIKKIVQMLRIKPIELIRKEEKIFKKLYKTQQLSDDQCINILHENPILIQRPIVVKDNCAILGRPPVNVLALLK